MTKTRVYNVEDLKKPEVQKDIYQTFQHGKNVVFPTETVYGIGANALSELGINNIYKIKGRPSDNPLIMHFSDASMISDYVYQEQDYVSDLIQQFWPGPLTLVFNKKNTVPDYFTGGLKTVGVRIPGSKTARDIISIAGVPVCAPSANISGRPSSTLFEHVLEDFENKVEIIIDGGKSQVGLESTVLDVTKKIPVILRPGVITTKMIEEVVGSVQSHTEARIDEVPKSPGMKYKHYAPKGDLIIVEGDPYKVVQQINELSNTNMKNGKKVGVITTNEYYSELKASHIYVIGLKDNEEEIASNIFAALRDMDAYNMDVIYSFSFRGNKYEEAIMNRLLKAANNQVIDVENKKT